MRRFRLTKEMVLLCDQPFTLPLLLTTPSSIASPGIVCTPVVTKCTSGQYSLPQQRLPLYALHSCALVVEKQIVQHKESIVRMRIFPPDQYPKTVSLGKHSRATRLEVKQFSNTNNSAGRLAIWQYNSLEPP